MSAQRNPGEAADKRRYSERQAQDHAPQAPPRQIAAFQQPRQRQPDHAAGQRHSDHQRQGVAQQTEHIRSPEQMQRLGPARLPGLEPDIGQRQQAEYDQQQNRQQQPDRWPLAPRHVSAGRNG
ncbi:hypothetical protein D3C87_1250500 [compost metagenome]